MATWAIGRSIPDVRSRQDGAARRLVRAWLYGLAALVVLMVAVGGATRLTGSGLSITEWRPVTGAIPPLGAAGWAEEFAKYTSSSQYQILNRGMELGEFKAIYWWEWSHRQLGRLIGLYVFLPLAWFWWTRRISSTFAAKLLGIGALGGLQAGIGWIMVASGLEAGMIAVAPIKLALHLLVASAILALIVWLAAGLLESVRERNEPRGARLLAFGVLAAIVLQIGLGGLVAGSKAGLTYNTWPLMDGRLVPSTEALFVVRPWIENLVDNPTLVQFNHRLVAYLVLGLTLVQAWVWRRASRHPAAHPPRPHAEEARHAPSRSTHARGASFETRPPAAPQDEAIGGSGAGSRRAGGASRTAWVAAIALAQAGLGITTLLLAVPLWAGLAHQLLAMGLLAAATFHARRTAIGGRQPPPMFGAAPQPA